MDINTCLAKKCTRVAVAKGFCCKHYVQVKRHGKVLERTKYDPNEIIYKDTYCEVVLYEGHHEQKEIARAIIDISEAKKVGSRKWCINSYNQVVGARISLAQFIKGKAPKGFYVDHLDGDSKNNRLNNLMIRKVKFKNNEK